MTMSIEDAVERYRQGAIASANVSEPTMANKGATQLHSCYKNLRGSEEGRQALIRLMDDREPSVRCWAAAECLQWQPSEARRVLESLRDSQGPFSLDAELTLREYDSGQLAFD
jgi:hypothetical protein